MSYMPRKPWSPPVQTKTCTKCGETEPLEEFNKYRWGRYGVRDDCKECGSTRQTERGQATRTARGGQLSPTLPQVRRDASSSFTYDGVVTNMVTPSSTAAQGLSRSWTTTSRSQPVGLTS